MTEPKRIQLSRIKGWRKPEGAIVVSRPSKWGNPFVVGSLIGMSGHDADGMQFETGQIPMTVDMAVAAYRDLLAGRLGLDWDPDHLLNDEALAYVTEWRGTLAELRGHDLACWCPLDQPCHADVLLEIANRDL